MTEQRPDLVVPRLPGRSRTYATVLATTAALVLAALVLPLTLGHPPRARPGSATALTPYVPPTSGTAPEATASTGPAAGSPSAAPPGSGSATGAGPAPTGAAPANPGTRSATRPPVGPGRRSGAGGTASGPLTGAGSRTASDQGVSPDEIVLGVAIVTLAQAASVGANTSSYNSDEQKAFFQSFVKDVNARGGINGRRVRDEYVTFNILDSSSQTAACKELTETRKAFAVVSVLGLYGDPILCFTNDHKTPYLAIDGAVSDYYQKAGGLLFTTQPSTLRTQANAAFELNALGELKGPGKIGFIYENGYLLPDEEAVTAYVQQLTGSSVTTAVVSSNGSEIGTALGQSRSAAVQMCSAGVDKVFLGLNSLYAQQFVDSWDRTTCPPPKYFMSDFDYQSAGDSFVSGMPDSFFTRALTVTSSIVGGVSSGERLRPLEQHCLDVNAQQGGPSKPPQSAEEIIAACGLVALFERGVQRAGLNPTRRSFADALAALGSFPNPGFAASAFRPGKLDAPDEVRVIRAELACKCNKLTGTGAFKAARFR